jgi:hypothetical protein
VPNLNHLWQRLMITSALIVGLAIGVAATVFGYSNLASVDVHFSVFHINGVPLWTVAVVPLAITLAAGTLYHWADGLHHFTEHMRHRRRVHELEGEVASIRAHLDQVLEMPDHSELQAKRSAKVSLPSAEEDAPLPVLMEAAPEPVENLRAPAVSSPEPVALSREPVALPSKAAIPARKAPGERRKRVRLAVASEPMSGVNGEASSATAAAAKPNLGA